MIYFLNDDITWDYSAEEGYRTFQVQLYDRQLNTYTTIYNGKLFSDGINQLHINISEILNNYAYSYPLSLNFAQSYNKATQNLFTNVLIKDITNPDSPVVKEYTVYFAHPYPNKDFERFIDFNPGESTNCLSSTLTQGTRFFKNVIGDDGKEHHIYVPTEDYLPHYPFIKTDNYGIVNTLYLGEESVSDRDFHYIMNNRSIYNIMWHQAPIGSVADHVDTLSNWFNNASYDKYLYMCHNEIDKKNYTYSINWISTTYNLSASSATVNTFLASILRKYGTGVAQKFETVRDNYPFSGFPKTVVNKRIRKGTGPASAPAITVNSPISLGLVFGSEEEANTAIYLINTYIPMGNYYVLDLIPYSSDEMYIPSEAYEFMIWLFQQEPISLNPIVAENTAMTLLAEMNKQAAESRTPQFRVPYYFGSQNDIQILISLINEKLTSGFCPGMQGEIYEYTYDEDKAGKIFDLNLAVVKSTATTSHENMAPIAAIDECAADYYLMWQDRLGGIMSRGFSGKSTFRDDYTYKQVEDSYGHKRNVIIDSKPTWELNTTFLNENEYVLYESIFTSPRVILYSTKLDKSYMVIPQGKQFVEKRWDNTKKISNFTITVELDKNQQFIY